MLFEELYKINGFAGYFSNLQGLLFRKRRCVDDRKMCWWKYLSSRVYVWLIGHGDL